MAPKDKKLIWRFSYIFNAFRFLTLKIEVLFKVNHTVVVLFYTFGSKGMSSSYPKKINLVLR